MRMLIAGMEETSKAKALLNDVKRVASGCTEFVATIRCAKTVKKMMIVATSFQTRIIRNKSDQAMSKSKA